MSAAVGNDENESSLLELTPSNISPRSLRGQSARNLLRGVLTASDENIAKRTMENLRRQCTPADALVAFAILQLNATKHHLPQPIAFPQNGQQVDQAPFFAAAPIAIEFVALGLRLAQDQERLIGAIKLLSRINASILDGNQAAIAELFAEYREQFGISFIVAQKAISLRHSSRTKSDRRADYSEVITPFLSPRRQVIAVAFEDSIDDERDYTRVRRTFLRFVTKDQLDPGDAAIISDLFSPHFHDKVILAQRVQAYGRWGLLDATACLYRMRRVFELNGMLEEAEAVDAIIPSSVADAWRSAFDSIDIARLQTFIGMHDQFFDRTLFAHLPAWSEYQDLFDYRVRIEEAIAFRLDGQFPVPTRSASHMVAPRNRIEDLLVREPHRVSISEVDPANCGAFHRTIALISSIEAGGLGEITGEQLSSLLDQTVDVVSMLSTDELAKLMPPRKSDHLYEFLRTAVLNDLEENKVNNHALRRSLQLVVQSRFDGDIVGLLKHVDTERGHVSKHLYNLCSEAFLTELYDLFEVTDQITEAHTNILEWWGAKANDEDAKLRAKSHRLTLRLRKVRGAIEETRIYVDPLRFIAWIQEEIAVELRTLSIQADLILADPSRTFSFKNQVQLAVQPRMKLLALFERCYEEFCTNKLYGVTSFIGRRIRHGTLHGHLVLELKPDIEAYIAEFRHSAPNFAQFLGHWFSTFDAAVQLMAADRIHVRSKEKARGLIVATLEETEKVPIANRMVEDVARSMLERPQLAQGASLIHEYCWLLFEVDLKRTRDAVEELRREFVISVDEHPADRADIDRRVNERIRSLNSRVQQKFDIVRSWFTRPTNQSPSASVGLLFEAVQDEVRQHFPHFKPKLDITGTNDVDLIGHRFHFFYDALFILVGNAAKHGQPDGVLGIHISSSFTEDKYTYLSVSVKSDLICGKQKECKERIEQVMVAEIGDAMMKNQNSGIRKLREMVEDVEEIIGFKRRYDGDSVIFTIDMRYIRT